MVAADACRDDGLCRSSLVSATHVISVRCLTSVAEMEACAEEWDSLCEGADGFWKGISLMFDEKVDRAPRFLASETMKEASIRIDVETRTLLFMKWTQPHERSSTPF